MSIDDEYELVVTPPPRRALTDRLPEAVAAAAIKFLTTALIHEPQRVGKPLHSELAGSGRRGAAPIILYRIREESHEVVVLRIEHRRDAYRPP